MRRKWKNNGREGDALIDRYVILMTVVFQKKSGRRLKTKSSSQIFKSDPISLNNSSKYFPKTRKYRSRTFFAS